jgi:single-stranded-DNA-specific exonuclease
VPGVHITELLREVSDLLLDVGGHPLAAGFRIETARIDEFKSVFIAKAKTQIDPSLLQQVLSVDCQLPENLINLSIATDIKQLEPFGPANREPLFLFSALKVVSSKRVGKDMRHLSLRFELENGQNISAIAFGQAESDQILAENSVVDVVAALEINEWKGRQSVQLLVKSLS